MQMQVYRTDTTPGRRLCRQAAIAATALAVCSAAFAEEAPPPRHRPMIVRELVEQVQPSVVRIDAYQTVPKGLAVRTLDFLNPFPLRTFVIDTLKFVFYIPRAIFYPFSSHRLGSGFMVDDDGHIATNYHVIEDYNHFTVTFIDGSVRPAEVVARDEMGDIALLKADLSGLGDAVHPVQMGDSDAVRPGDSVVVIGSPLGLDNTVTTGVVSGVGRRIGSTDLDDLIQIDAALDLGNSGGPVFDSQGRVIGISAANIWLAENKGFAIPIKMLSTELDNMLLTGEPRRGRIGVIVETPTVLFAKSRGLDKPTGALVMEVKGGSPAERAGLRRGDLVVEFDGTRIEDSVAFVRAVRRSTPGVSTTLKVLRAPGTLARPKLETPAIEEFELRPELVRKPFRVF